MKPLYQISEDYQKIMDMIDESGEFNPEQLEMLGQVESDIEKKCESIVYITKNLDHMIEGVQKRICELEKREGKLVKQLSWLKNYLLNNLITLEKQELKTEEFDIKVRENKYALDIHSTDLIEDKYVKTTVNKTIDKRLIIEDLKKGIEVPGAEFKPTKSVVIR